MAEAVFIKCDTCQSRVDESHWDTVCIKVSQDQGGAIISSSRSSPASFGILVGGNTKAQGYGRMDFCNTECLLKALKN